MATRTTPPFRLFAPSLLFSRVPLLASPVFFPSSPVPYPYNMRAVIQRVSEARVYVKDEVVGQIGQGLVILLGVATSDTTTEADYLSEKIVNLRIFSDKAGKFALSVQDVQGAVLVISQFTLYGDCRKGRRPSFTDAAGIDKALPLYEYFVERLKQLRVPVATGRFQATMAVQLVNDGPVTLILESNEKNA